MKISLNAHSILAVAGLLVLGAWYAPAPLPTSAGPTPIVGWPAVINDPGAYCMVGNVLVATPGAAIQVNAEGVVIDMGGFTLTGGGTGEVGIQSDFPCLEVKNGTVTNYSVAGLSLAGQSTVSDLKVSYCGNGILGAEQVRVENSVLLENLSSDLDLGAESEVVDCRVKASVNSISVQLEDGGLAERVNVRGGLIGFKGGIGSRFIDCVATEFRNVGFQGDNGNSFRGCFARGRDTNSRWGIRSSDGSRIESCTANGPLEVGLSVGEHSLVTKCVVSNTELFGITCEEGVRIDNCQVSECNRSETREISGIQAGAGTSIRETSVMDCKSNGITIFGDGGQVQHCVVSGNEGHGLCLNDGVDVRWNQLLNNGLAGVLCRGNRSVLAENLIDANGDGVVLEGHSTLLVGNRSLDNAGEDYDIQWGNPFGPMLGTIGQIGGSVPQANF